MAERSAKAVERLKSLGGLISCSAFNLVHEAKPGRNRQEKMLFLIFIILAAASIFIGVLGGFWEIKLGWNGFEEPNRVHYSYLFFTGSVSRQFTIGDGRLLTLYYDVKVDRGSLTISVVKIPGHTLWERRFDQNSSGSVKIGLSYGGVYSIIVKGKGTEGKFDLRWEIS
ncbi:MAG: hypothetical protein J7J19_03850 [Thaumarchaeota archaeon]|nr:hypothetical protein [Nitrososphaerota archaeon]